MQRGQKAMDKLFWEIQALMLRTLRAVDRLVISDKQCFEVRMNPLRMLFVLQPFKETSKRNAVFPQAKCTAMLRWRIVSSSMPLHGKWAPAS